MFKLTIAAVLCLNFLLAGCDDISTEPPEMQTMHESRPVGETKQLNVDLRYDVGNLEISKISDENLFAFDLQYDRRHYDPKFNFAGGANASMRLDIHGRGNTNPRGNENDLALKLSDKVPLDLDVTAGVTESRLEMSTLQLERLHLRGGVGKTEITFDSGSPVGLRSFDVESGVGELIVHGLGNTHVERLDLKGGVGHAELDFTGDLGMTRTDATIKVGVGSLKIAIPRDADVEIEGSGGLLSNISAPSFDHNGNRYTHRGNGGASIRIHVESGIGGVEVELK
jgi:hypothetical protein